MFSGGIERGQQHEIGKEKLQRFLKDIHDILKTFQGHIIFFKVLQSSLIIMYSTQGIYIARDNIQHF